MVIMHMTIIPRSPMRGWDGNAHLSLCYPEDFNSRPFGKREDPVKMILSSPSDAGAIHSYVKCRANSDRQHLQIGDCSGKEARADRHHGDVVVQSRLPLPVMLMLAMPECGLPSPAGLMSSAEKSARTQYDRT